MSFNSSLLASSAKLQAFDPSEKIVSCMMSDKEEKMDKTPLRYRVEFQDQLVTAKPGMISHRSWPEATANSPF